MRPLLTFFLAGTCAVCHAQADSVRTDSLQQFAPKVYFTCGTCPIDYIKEQMPYLNYVRDRHVADVHVIGTTQTAGNGGIEGTLIFIGQNAFAGMNDTLVFNTFPAQTEQEKRDIKLGTFQMGMMRYIARTPLRDRFAISYTAPADPAAVTDKWKSWIFSLSGYSYFAGQQTYSSANLGLSLSARKVTEDWKIELDGSLYYNEDRFDINGVEVLGITRSQYGEANVVRTIDDHWSVGGFGSIWSSLYGNMRLGISVAPAIEFNVFPYSKSTMRQLRVSYRPGFVRHHYFDTTIYNEIREDLWNHSLGVAFKMTQKWGSLSGSAYGSSYFHDFQKNSLDLYASASLRIVKGLSVGFGVGYSFVHDQLSLPKAGATDEELLLQLRQIATTYSYHGNFSISYTFGSIYNTVVNPRFGTNGG